MTRPAPRPPAQLAAQHGRILRIFDFLAASRASDEQVPRDAIWEVAIEALDRHLAAEEVWVDRLVASGGHGDLGARVRVDHANVRRTLDELGLLLQLHAASPGALADFAALLRNHVAFEEATLYPALGEGPPAEPAAVSVVPIGVVLGAAAGAVGGAALGPLGVVTGVSCGALVGGVAASALDGVEATAPDDAEPATGR